MEEFKQFIVENKVIILTCLNIFQCLLVIVMALISKKIQGKPIKVVDTLKEKILAELPELIYAAEKRFGAGHGAEKLQFVLDFFTWEFDKNGLVMTESYINFIKSSVENILATPSKKGGN